MDVIIENRQEKVDFREAIGRLIKKSIEETLNYEGLDFIDEVDVLLVDNEAIRILNRDFRDVDKETDVLSFPMYNGIEDIMSQRERIGPMLLGDIVISLERAKAQGLDFGHGIEREVSYLTVHSILHLLGYDHMQESDKKIMREKEKNIMMHMGIER
ncbi:MAG: rRNA maturation RNase YbeY [Peptostreptococcaceae bacterium]|nr:rRNA maturation RNase YbeY [Peptostreptococcaceae bacterium]